MTDREWAGKGWRVAVTETEMTLATASGAVSVPGSEAFRLGLKRRWFRLGLYNDDRLLVHVGGLTRSEAQELEQALRRLWMGPAAADAVGWHAAAAGRLAGALAEQRWFPTERADELLAHRPEFGLIDRLRGERDDPILTAGEREAVAFLDRDLESLVVEVNEQIMASELVARRQFFDTIEKSPLTEEQARAVVCFDNRVQVLAAAGSGKTSVMVARAAYAVSRGLVPADRILVLAFNKAAATELQDRISERFAAAGIDSSGLRASTFHSFGLDVIGRATGEKPRLASWLDGDDSRMVLRIVDELRDASQSFRYRWDLYRLLYANAPTDLDVHEPDGYSKETREKGYRTFGGEIVKSHGERLIANFLYLYGVRYVYERAYDVNVADATHSQYRPDFYYPDINVWHEHWALDRDGKPPASFDGYADSMAWKRSLHAEQGSTLVESTWAGVLFGSGLDDLKEELTGLGLTFDWNPDRPINDQWAKPMKHEDLARLIRTFMTHVKSNSSTPERLEARLESDLAHLQGFRTRLFLEVYWQVHAEWERRLTDDQSVDFEDMLVRAADHLEAGDVDSPYDLVMVDEFQDASQARARLVRGLVKAKPGRFLLAVGDDWQSINRFAGADLSVMTDFESWFGRGPRLALTTTFRCPQTVCDVASSFVSKNPDQFNKPMRSAHDDPGPPVTVIIADDAARALASYLDELSSALADGRIQPCSGGKVSVDVLGRYGFERNVLPRRSPSNLLVTFRTVHGSKGLEADYIVVPGMTAGTYGFPSTIADDPVLDLAMPSPESYAHAEERRLFYVALTRARRHVTLITPQQRMSPFVVELLGDPRVIVTGSTTASVEICPTCGQGTMVQRNGPYGPFLGCSTFPKCNGTRRVP